MASGWGISLLLGEHERNGLALGPSELASSNPLEVSSATFGIIEPTVPTSYLNSALFLNCLILSI